MQLKPTALDKKQVTKVLKVALYIMGSGAAASLVSWLATDSAKELLGYLWPAFNVLAVYFEQLFTPAK
jgi:hypothetical protein